MVKKIEFDEVDSDTTTEVSGEESATLDSVVITAEVGGGTVTWQPGEHMQHHLQQAADEGALDEAVEALREMLVDGVEEIQASVCMMALMGDPETIATLLSRVFISGGEGVEQVFGDPFAGIGLGQPFGESFFGGDSRF